MAKTDLYNVTIKSADASLATADFIMRNVEKLERMKPPIHALTKNS